MATCGTCGRARDDNGCGKCDAAQEISVLRARLHDSAHILIERIGAPDGPENADSVARRAVASLDEERVKTKAAEAERHIWETRARHYAADWICKVWDLEPARKDPTS